VADQSNFGTWMAAGGLTAADRATAIWKDVLARFVPPAHGQAAGDRVRDFIERRTAAGGAPPE